MAAFLMIAVAALAWQRPRLALAALFGATLMRHNALFAVVPLVPFTIAQAWPSLRGARRWGAIAGACVALAIAPWLAERALGARQQCVSCIAAQYDLAGVYVQDPTGYDSSVLHSFVSLEQLRKSYSPRSNGWLFSFVPQVKTVELPQLLPEWRAMWKRHPGLLALDKLETFGWMLGLHESVCYPFQAEFIEPAGRVRRALRAVEEFTRDWPFFRAVAWLGFAIVLGVIALRRRRELPACLALSAVIYLFSFLPVVPSCDFRYAYWPMLACLSGTLLMLTPRET
jgi:hypothetical protein